MRHQQAATSSRLKRMHHLQVLRGCVRLWQAGLAQARTVQQQVQQTRATFLKYTPSHSAPPKCVRRRHLHAAVLKWRETSVQRTARRRYFTDKLTRLRRVYDRRLARAVVRHWRQNFQQQ